MLGLKLNYVSKRGPNLPSIDSFDPWFNCIISCNRCRRGQLGMTMVPLSQSTLMKSHHHHHHVYTILRTWLILEFMSPLRRTHDSSCCFLGLHSTKLFLLWFCDNHLFAKFCLTMGPRIFVERLIPVYIHGSNSYQIELRNVFCSLSFQRGLAMHVDVSKLHSHYFS